MINMKNKDAPIYIINQKKRPERFFSTINELSKVNLNNFIIRKEGCSPERAKALKYEYISEEVQENIDNELVSCTILPTWGAVGCAISHIEIWKEMIENNIKYAFILEDDNIIYDKDKFLWMYNKALKKIKKTEYIPILISLYSNINENYKTFIEDNIYIPTDFFTGLSCYFLSCYGARELIKKIVSLRLQIDLEVGNIFKNNNGLDKFKIHIYENCGIKQNEKFYSDVQFHFLTTEEIYNLFKIPYEIADKIFYYLPQKDILYKYDEF